jgi:hypothetical protein
MTESTDPQLQPNETPNVPTGNEPMVHEAFTSAAPEIHAPAVVEETQTREGLSPGAIFFGVLVTLGFIAFVLLARVTVHPFDQVDRRMRVLDVWQRLRNHLPEVAHPTLLRVIFDVSIIMIVVGSLACVWLALLAANTKKPRTEAGSSKPSDPQFFQAEH